MNLLEKIFRFDESIYTYYKNYLIMQHFSSMKLKFWMDILICRGIGTQQIFSYAKNLHFGRCQWIIARNIQENLQTEDNINDVSTVTIMRAEGSSFVRFISWRHTKANIFNPIWTKGCTKFNRKFSKMCFLSSYRWELRLSQMTSDSRLEQCASGQKSVWVDREFPSSSQS